MSGLGWAVSAPVGDPDRPCGSQSYPRRGTAPVISVRFCLCQPPCDVAPSLAGSKKFPSVVGAASAWRKLIVVLHQGYPHIVAKLKVTRGARPAMPSILAGGRYLSMARTAESRY